MTNQKELKIKYSLWCSATMQRYEVEDISEYQAKIQLSRELSVLVSCIDVFR